MSNLNDAIKAANETEQVNKNIFDSILAPLLKDAPYNQEKLENAKQ